MDLSERAGPAGRIVIVDWETYNPNSPFHTIDHPENVAAVFYVHMWGNPAWQAAYRGALNERVRLLRNQLRQRGSDPSARTGEHVDERHRPAPGGHPSIDHHQRPSEDAEPMRTARPAPFTQELAQDNRTQ